ncbi:protein ABHD8-like [Ptychodera flava]|uniref:protein ABHD8-like n=1 Tax=Ptychodera flava TaxID=63121 RepID=UPI00396A8A69
MRTMGEESGCCQGTERQQRRVEPSPGKYEGFEMVQIRPKRMMRIQHLRPNRTTHNSVQDNGISDHSKEHSVNQTRESIEYGVNNHHNGFSENVITTDVTASSERNDYKSNWREHGTHSNRQTPMSMQDIQVTPDEIAKRVNGVVQEDMQPADQNNVVLFFLHGVGGSSDVWTKQLQYFANHGYEVVAPDMLGHGFSSTPRDASAYSFFQLYQDLLAVFDKYSTKRNILIGHSYGASFTAKIATERRSVVRKLIMISGGGPLPLKPALCHVFCLPSCLLECCRSRLQDSFFRQAFHNFDPSSEDKEHSFDIPSYVLRGIMLGQVWEEGDEDYHRCITPETLLIYGSGDKLVTRDDEEWMNEAIHDSELKVIDGVGHMVMIESPDLVNRYIHEFITKRAAITRTPRPTTSMSKSVSYRRESKIVW